MELRQLDDHQHLLGRSSETYHQGRHQAAQAVNRQFSEAFWNVGRDIIEFEQGGKVRAEYGKGLIDNLARDLKLRHGRGFSRSNLIYMRLFYLKYPKSQKPSHQLS